MKKLVILIAGNGTGAGKSKFADFVASYFLQKSGIPIAGNGTEVGESKFADFVASYFLQKSGFYTPMFYFCEPVKAMLRQLLYYAGYTESEIYEALYGANKEGVFKLWGVEQPVTHRQLLQKLGTEWRLGLGLPNLWAELVAKSLSRHFSLESEEPVVIIDDWRYPNEYEAIKTLEAQDVRVLTVLIHRPDAVKQNHSSEGSLKDFEFDYVFANDSSLEDYKDVAYKFAEGLMKYLTEDLKDG